MGMTIAVLHEDGKVCSCQILLYKTRILEIEEGERFFNITYEILSGPEDDL
jgi:hypothetical protein